MKYITTLKYDKPILKRAAYAYWKRSVGSGVLIALLVIVIAIGFQLENIYKSWFFGALISVLSLCIVFIIAIFFVHYKNALGKLRDMGLPEATFIAEPETFTFTSEVGSSTFKWAAIKEVWRYEEFWLLMFSKAQFSTVPTANVPLNMQEYIVQKVREAGGNVS